MAEKEQSIDGKISGRYVEKFYYVKYKEMKSNHVTTNVYQTECHKMPGQGHKHTHKRRTR